MHGKRQEEENKEVRRCGWKRKEKQEEETIRGLREGQASGLTEYQNMKETGLENEDTTRMEDEYDFDDEEAEAAMMDLHEVVI